MPICAHCGETIDERARYCSNCGQPLALPVTPRGSRKTVTVVFADLVNSTRLGERLDAETLREVLGRYYETTRKVLEEYGGTVEKFIGDAVVAVFGVPVLHEDDALRAVTAAARLQVTLDRLNEDLDREWSVRLQVRMGVNTGEVLAAEGPDHETPILSDAVNVAARLEQLAEPGDILIGDSTYLLIRHAVIADPLPSLKLEGKAVLVPAWRVVHVDPEAYRHPRRTDAPLVGRKLELDLLRKFYERANAGRRFHLAIVFGEAGVGKTRLVDEFERVMGEEATVLRGRCRSYGEGITYWPIVQMVRQLAGIGSADSREAGYGKLATLLADPRITNQVAQVLGLRHGAHEPKDAYWALQRMLQILASRRPLVLVIDDLHWAQPTLLDFVHYLASSSLDLPILLVCVTRTELFDEAPSLTVAGLDAMSIRLHTLDGEQSKELVGHLLRPGVVGPELRARLAEASAGFPLFLEEFIGMLIDDQTLRLEGGRWTVASELTELRSPATIHALLSARVDELGERERVVLSRAAVVGRRFETRAVVALSPEFDESEVHARLVALVRKELLVVEAASGPPDPATLDQFRFRHSLIQEAAYGSTPKEDRADLHVRYASWLERQATADNLEVAEILGYHLEQAYRHRLHLARRDETTMELGRRAGERLAIAGHQAVNRGDIPATAVKLLASAIDLLPEDHQRRLDVLLDLADALREAEDLTGALATYTRAVEVARAGGDRRHAAHALLGRLDTLWFMDPRQLDVGGRQEARQVIPVLERLGDDLGLAKAWRVLAYAQFAMGESIEAQQAAERAIASARRAGDQRLEARIVRLNCVILFWGPTPLDEVSAYVERALGWARQGGAPSLEASALSILARTTAMRGNFVQARTYLEAAKAIPVDVGEGLSWAANSVTEGLIELLAEKFAAAEEVLRDGCEKAEKMGRRGQLATLMVMRARALLGLERDDQAAELAARCKQMAHDNQPDFQIRLQGVQAVLMARRGDHDPARRFADEAVSMAEASQQPDTRATALMDLAEVLRLAEQREPSRRLAERALGLYRDKGDLVGQEAVARFLAELREADPSRS